MMTGMYAAISGLDANQVLLDDTASDLANVNTVGYKSSSVTFAESLTQVMHGASGPTATNGGSNPVQIGLGVQVSATRNEMSEGSFQTTNNPLDVAIEGKGFLRVGSGTPPAAPPYTAGLPASVRTALPSRPWIGIGQLMPRAVRWSMRPRKNGRSLGFTRFS